MGVAAVEQAILWYCVVSTMSIDVVAVLIEKAIVDKVGKWISRGCFSGHH